MNLNKKDRIFIAGHNGMVGSSILRKLRSEGYTNLCFSSRKDLDLTNQKETFQWFSDNKFDVVIDCAAKVGGIHANNTYRADFIYNNLQIQNNIIHASYKTKVKKLLFLGSVCIYPKFTDQPIKEEYLLRSPLEPTNEPYALAKIAGIKMCESYYRQYGCQFMSVMPANLYGPNDNFHLENSHVLPALLRKFHEAKEENSPTVKVWGTGEAMREFMHVDDLADACVHVLKECDFNKIYSQNVSQINLGTGKEISIKNLANLIAKVVNYEGKIEFDTSRPDGTLRRVLDNKRINDLGWSHEINLEEGLKSTYQWFKNNLKNIKEI